MTVAFNPRVLSARAARAVEIVWAFARMSAQATFSYPMSFFLLQVSTIVQLVAFYFLARIVHQSASLGSDYLTFAAVGAAALQIPAGGIVGLGQELDWTIQEGRMEMLLIEPISWRIIPLALAAWPTLYRLVNAGLLLLVAWGLGATLTVNDVPALIGLVVLGATSGLVIGVTAGAIRMIAKRSDPIATLYIITASVVSGAGVPINLFPAPLRAFSWVFPSTYIISGMRKVLMPHASHIYGPSPDQAMLLLLAVCVILLPVSVWFFGRSLEVGRRYGVLAGY